MASQLTKNIERNKKLVNVKNPFFIIKKLQNGLPINCAKVLPVYIFLFAV
jgi:hypothetical protein